MKISRHLYYITTADFIARAAYQMGKTPLLPIFAALLGASDVFLGFIVSVSTLTGMVLKPLIGFLSDRWGRKAWLLLGTAFFAGMPFVYGLIQTPEQLFVVRVVHGLATAIYGPVTLAYVAEHNPTHLAEKLGWFGMARSAGYVVGPALAGWLLLWLPPVQVFTLIGFMSCMAFLPIIGLPEKTTPRQSKGIPLRPALRLALLNGGRTPGVWLAGGLESALYVALYAVRTFLPLYALSLGINVAVVGLFFAVQEAVHLVLKPLGGWLGDLLGYGLGIGSGLVLLGICLPLLGVVQSATAFLCLSMGLGAAQALALPATIALASQQLSKEHLGAGLGLVGTLQNAGKVIGPILGGLLIRWLDYGPMFMVLGACMLIGAVGVNWCLAMPKKQSLSKPT